MFASCFDAAVKVTSSAILSHAAHPESAAVYGVPVQTGSLMDAGLSVYPVAGQMMSYTIVVTNAGTSTLAEVEVTGSGALSCNQTQPVEYMDVESSYKCWILRQVCPPLTRICICLRSQRHLVSGLPLCLVILLSDMLYV